MLIEKLRSKMARLAAETLKQPRLDTLMGRCENAFVKRGRDRRLAEHALRLADLKPDHNALTIGFGRGWVFRAAYDNVLREGTGKIYGIDRSQNAVDAARKFCKLEMDEGKAEPLFGHPSLLPFKNDFFDRIFFNDEFYFWPNPFRCLREIYRVAAPGALLVCTLDLQWLKSLEASKRLPPEINTDPLNFMVDAERAGFERIRIEYLSENDDRNQDRSPPAKNILSRSDYQAIYAEKPLRQQKKEPVTDEELDEAEYELMELLAVQESLRRAKKLNPSLSPDNVDRPPERLSGPTS